MDKKPRRKSSIKIEISHDAKKDGKGTFTRKKSVAGDEMSFIRRKKLAESEGFFLLLFFFFQRFSFLFILILII